jgi:branched-chain amino acid transport system substrate-binding protein
MTGNSRLFATTIAAVMLTAGAALAQEPIRIGAINPYSGPVALYGDEVARGYQLAIDEANAKGGVIGRKIELLRGDASNPQQGIAAVEETRRRQGRHLRRDLYQCRVQRRERRRAALQQDLLYTNALASDLTARGLPNFIRSGPYASSFAEVSVNAARTCSARRSASRSRASRYGSRASDRSTALDREAAKRSF